ncbi:MAG: stage II sporulation protein M [Gemmatimonadaceae bacterium]|jgi:uncharacterized membrane protein SpoIIM required for sporulation/uncharacterized RDD family membrane protein YckC|nr:stage II sporulation protein M [Gemmatimonadaceae bacterium]
MASTSRLLDPVVEVETPEQVLVAHTLAGPGARAAAVLLDFAIVIAGFVAIAWLAGAVSDSIGVDRRRLGDEWGFVVLIVGQFLLQWGYYVFCEAAFDGQTPGKRLLGLRVVRVGGGGVDFGASAARNLVRIIDQQPGALYAVGIITSLLNTNGQRLGDMVAGTIVVRERPIARGFGVVPPPAATDPALPAAVPRLDDATFALLDTFVARVDGYAPDARARLATAMAARVALADAGDEPVPALRALHAAELVARATVTAGRSDGTTRREEWALVADGRPRWEAFAARIAAVKKAGLASLDEEAVTAFVDDYRSIAADLARLRTADRGRGGDAVYSLSRLVAAGHNLIYRRPTATVARVLRFIARDIPAEVRRSWRPIAVAAALLFIPAAITIAAVVHEPALAERLLPEGMLARAEEGMRRANTGGEYLPGDQAGPVLAGLITTNNVQVTFVAFAGGIVFGIGTVFALVFNGVAAVGAGVGLYISRGIGGQILGFVAAHGVLELAAIAIAGGGGLLLGTALLLPGDRTRREALVANGLRALHLIGCSTLFLLVAGVIEGNISPARLPNEVKYGVAALTAVAMAAYLWPRAANPVLRPPPVAS